MSIEKQTDPIIVIDKHFVRCIICDGPCWGNIGSCAIALPWINKGCPYKTTSIQVSKFPSTHNQLIWGSIFVFPEWYPYKTTSIQVSNSQVSLTLSIVSSQDVCHGSENSRTRILLSWNVRLWLYGCLVYISCRRDEKKRDFARPLEKHVANMVQSVAAMGCSRTCPPRRNQSRSQ